MSMYVSVENDVPVCIDWEDPLFFLFFFADLNATSDSLLPSDSPLQDFHHLNNNFF